MPYPPNEHAYHRIEQSKGEDAQKLKLDVHEIETALVSWSISP
jgi:hypothetical protein